jgi:nucleotide-binding universal stress UspA family protein
MSVLPAPASAPAPAILTPQVILAALDASAQSVLVSQTALAFAERAPRSRLHFVHVIEATSDGPFPLGAPRAGVRSALAVVEEAERYVEAHARWAADRLEREVGGHVLEGSPRRAILQLGVDLGADLLVVGTHAQRRLERVVFGSVAEALTREAPFCVLVARASPAEQPVGLRAPCEQCLESQRDPRSAELWCPTHAPQHRTISAAAS